MSKHAAADMAAVTGSIILILLCGIGLVPIRGQTQGPPEDNKSDEQVTGPYEVVENWPKPLTSLPGHEKWTWGAVEGIFAQNPNRVFILERGELPALARPKNTPIPEFGPSLSYPVSHAPFRNASVGPMASAGDADSLGKPGFDYRWEHILVVLDSHGNIIEDWSQWNSMLKRPHSIFINPYDPEKHVWVVDDAGCAIYEFTNDGKKLVLTLGTPGEPGADEKHFNGPTFLAWLPDSTLFVADGYRNSRVAKFDKNGNFLMAWGQKGEPPNEQRPSYFNTVHGIAVDPVARRVYVNDRTNRRIQVFDENGKFLDQWYLGRKASVYCIYMTADQHLWLADSINWKMLKYDLNGRMMSSWGTQGDWPGALWGVHQFNVDQEGNLYVAEVDNGRVQRFRPRHNADPAQLVGQPVRAAWKD
jgi:hypothetical protein